MIKNNVKTVSSQYYIIFTLNLRCELNNTPQQFVRRDYKNIDHPPLPHIISLSLQARERRYGRGPMVNVF